MFKKKKKGWSIHHPECCFVQPRATDCWSWSQLDVGESRKHLGQFTGPSETQNKTRSRSHRGEILSYMCFINCRTENLEYLQNKQTNKLMSVQVEDGRQLLDQAQKKADSACLFSSLRVSSSPCLLKQPDQQPTFFRLKLKHVKDLRASQILQY